MKVIQIKDSYQTWALFKMVKLIDEECWEKYDTTHADRTLKRSYLSMCIEWWLHNIGYYLTKPFRSVDFFKKINLRCRDVDLEEWVK